MARKKTKKQKKQTAERKQKKTLRQTQSEGVTYSIDEDLLKTKANKGLGQKKVATVELFDYDPKLLLGDIGKTVMLSLVFFGIEIGLYYFLR